METNQLNYEEFQKEMDVRDALSDLLLSIDELQGTSKVEAIEYCLNQLKSKTNEPNG